MSVTSFYRNIINEAIEPTQFDADGIAKALDLEGAENTQMARLQPAAIDALGLDWQTLTAVLAETHGRFEAHLPLLG